ncbi:hypothetical protein PybrP1_007645 [[Pythium] brassicae (nom. inval.)]|nr:hypothetical protein PybrP1_007645 [[Pythium] brassicae (nom. inval.)]
MGLKHLFSRSRASAHAPAQEPRAKSPSSRSSISISASASAASNSGTPHGHHRRHASLPPPLAASVSTAQRSSSVGQDLRRGAMATAGGDAADEDSDSSVFATALQTAPLQVGDTDTDTDEAEQKAAAVSPSAPVVDAEPRRRASSASSGLERARGPGVVMQGWLEKCGQQFKTWNWRFFVLRDDGVLSYYTDESCKKLKGTLPVGAGARADISVQTNLIEKQCVFMIASPERNTVISAPTQRLMTKWIAKLHRAGATPSAPWDPLTNTVKFFVRDAECPHEWKRYDDPTSYIHMEGCLLKRGHVNKNWKNRFFRIEKGELRYYTENQEELKGAVPLKGTVVSPGMAQCSDGRKYYFVLTSRDSRFEMHLNAHNEHSMHRWIEAIQEAQTALGKRVGAKETVSGLALVVKRAEEIPLAQLEVLYRRPQDIAVEIERRTEALVVTKAPKDDVPAGSQLIAIGRASILREAYAESRARLRAAAFPLTLAFVLPPYKKGVLVKKSRSGFENWKKRVLVVTNGEVHYYKQVGGGTSATLKHRKSFSLYGCYLNLVQFPNRPLCIVVARSPSDKLVLQTTTEEERIEWASVIYCSIRMVSQGITSGHIENLDLEKGRLPAPPAGDGDAADDLSERADTVSDLPTARGGTAFETRG